jgi:hypothetical protein
MSYDVYLDGDFDCPTCGQRTEDAPARWNYTTNCAPMWRKAGAELRDFSGKKASDCAPILAAALHVMRRSPDEFRAMNPDNGWGSYDTLVPALESLLRSMWRWPNATVRVHS